MNLPILCAQENGKKWDEAAGDVLKAIEVIEFACGATADDEGRVSDERLDRLRYCPVSRASRCLRRHRTVELSGHASAWVDGSHLHRHRNCIVLKVASFVPQSAMRISELWKQAGLPDGVLEPG